MDAECMGRLLTGLALSGAWGCFDEFNRLSTDTLAAVSHQLTSLLAAIARKPGTEADALLNGKQVSAFFGILQYEYEWVSVDDISVILVWLGKKIQE